VLTWHISYALARSNYWAKRQVVAWIERRLGRFWPKTTTWLNRRKGTVNKCLTGDSGNVVSQDLSADAGPNFREHDFLDNPRNQPLASR
jgi:hypothetical protein